MRHQLRAIAIAFTVTMSSAAAFANYDSALAAFKKGNFRAAMEQAVTASASGDVRADWLLGHMAIHDDKPNVGLTQGIRHLRKAATAGDYEAQMLLGFAHANGRGVKIDDVEAVKWYLKSAEHKHPTAMMNLANRYAEGRGVAKNIDEAIRWGLEAADTNLKRGEACVFMARLYRDGKEVPRDDVLSHVFYQCAQYFVGTTNMNPSELDSEKIAQGSRLTERTQWVEYQQTWLLMLRQSVQTGYRDRMLATKATVIER